MPAAAAKSLHLCPTLCNPIHGSPPGSPNPGILQASTLEWVAISFSSAWKWKVKVKSLSLVQLLVTPWTAAHQALLSMGFSRQEYWSRVPLPSPPQCLHIFPPLSLYLSLSLPSCVFFFFFALPSPGCGPQEIQVETMELWLSSWLSAPYGTFAAVEMTNLRKFLIGILYLRSLVSYNGSTKSKRLEEFAYTHFLSVSFKGLSLVTGRLLPPCVFKNPHTHTTNHLFDGLIRQKGFHSWTQCLWNEKSNGNPGEPNAPLLPDSLLSSAIGPPAWETSHTQTPPTA